MDTNSIKTGLATKFGRVQLVANKYSPEILMGLGVIGVVAGTVMACKKTIKALEISADHRDTLKEIDAVAEEHLGSETYSQEDYQRDKLLLLAKTSSEYIKLYGPAALTLVTGLGMLISSNRILQKRNASLMAAYAVLNEAYKTYRRRVVEELGEDVDYYFRFMEPREDSMMVVDGKKKEIKFFDEGKDLPGELVDTGASMYAVWFDNSSVQWRNDKTSNQYFLQMVQNYANQRLQSKGHVFWNEVLDDLGIPRTSAGAVVGWVKGSGDDCVDLGFMNPMNDWNRDYVNGYEDTGILIDPNVDGVIYDKI